MQPDELWPQGPCFTQSNTVFRLGTDAVLLSSFANAAGVRRLCDVGCGIGVIGILLLLKAPEAEGVFIDLQPEAGELTGQNLALNSLETRAAFERMDLRSEKDLNRLGTFDLVVSNPPYFSAGSGAAAQTPELAQARSELSCTLAEICAAGARLTRWGGRFAMVHRPERLAEVLTALSRSGLEPKRLRMVQKTGNTAPILFLVECRRGGNPGLQVEAPLVMCDEDGRDSEEIRRIYHRENA